MQFDIGQLLETLRAGIATIPPVVIAIVLLGGPTAGWLLYRFVVQPRTMRMRGVDPSAMWVCHNCRSINSMYNKRCYRCDALPIVDDLEVIDTHPAGPVRLTPVGPGLDLGGSGHPTGQPRPISRIERAPQVWVEQSDEWDGWNTEEELEEDRVTVPDLAAMTEVPGRPSAARPAVARPRRVSVAGGSRDPDDSPAA